MASLAKFIEESNKIEGIIRSATSLEIRAYSRFLGSDTSVETLEALVHDIQPGAILRREVGQNVTIGNDFPPPGGPEIEETLYLLLVSARKAGPYLAHKAYEHLHPFTDGNGRSGRALWLKAMGDAPLGFLHHWYYQSCKQQDKKDLADDLSSIQ